MKQWYEFYMADDANRAILHQVGAKIQESENQNPIKLHQLGAEFVASSKIPAIIDTGGDAPFLRYSAVEAPFDSYIQV